MSTALLAVLGALPWLTVLPLHGAAAVLAHVLTFVAALHGAGHVLAWAARRRELPALLAIQWGVAVLLAVSGVLIALGLDRYTAHVLLVGGFAAAHTAVIVLRARTYRAHLDDLLAGSRVWLVPTALLVLLGAFQVLAAAGDLGARPFDDDGHVLAQITRLRETGTLGDPVGYARHAQLGGQVALAALATAPGDVHLARLLEALACVLATGLALSRLALRDAFGALWGVLAVVGVAALAFVPADPVTCWTAVGLVLALHAMLDDERAPPILPLGAVAGALCTLRIELAPLALAALVAAAWRQRPAWSRLAALVATALAVVLPFLVARLLATRGLELSAIADRRTGLPLAVALFAATCLAGAPLVIWSWRHAALRWLAVGAVLVVAGVASELTGDRPYALRFGWPLAIAASLALVIELVRARTLSIAVMIAALLAGAVIHHGRSATGRAKWARRYLDAAMHLEYLRHTGDRAPIAGGYDDLLAHVPDGTTVAVWVARPERLPYARLDLVDLRTPRTSRLRRHRWEPHASRLERLARAAHAEYLLIERDDLRVERARTNPVYRVLCTAPHRACADDLELVALTHPVVAEAPGLQLVRLSP